MRDVAGCSRLVCVAITQVGPSMTTARSRDVDTACWHYREVTTACLQAGCSCTGTPPMLLSGVCDAAACATPALQCPLLWQAGLHLPQGREGLLGHSDHQRGAAVAADVWCAVHLRAGRPVHTQERI